jgi:hypothetical protein
MAADPRLIKMKMKETLVENPFQLAVLGIKTNFGACLQIDFIISPVCQLKGLGF